MPLTIDSTRFGRVEIADDSAIEFPNGLIGLESRRFALIAREQDADFLWLHSLDDPSLALPVTDPRRFFADFALELSDGERERLGLPELSEAHVYVTVRASERPEDFTANLRAPLVIADGHGHQVINHAEHAPLRAPLLEQLAAASEQAAGRAA